MIISQAVAVPLDVQFLEHPNDGLIKISQTYNNAPNTIYLEYSVWEQLNVLVNKKLESIENERS